MPSALSVACAACGHENPPGAKFCPECAAPLARRCAACGAEPPPTAKFCPECAAPLAARPQAAAPDPRAYTPKHLAEKILTSRAALEGERKQVTVLFADVKGATAPVHAYALEGLGRLRTRFDRARARGLSRFVGRDDEMRVLESALARAEHGEGQVIAVVAPAGTGKSRLSFELVEGCRAKGLAVIEAQALAHGRSIPLRPVLEMFRQRFGITERDVDLAAREKIAGALLLLDPSFAEKIGRASCRERV